MMLLDGQNKKARYFAGLALVRLGFGVNGSGGLASIALSKASVRSRACLGGSISSFANSSACCAFDSGFGMNGV